MKSVNMSRRRLAMALAGGWAAPALPAPGEGLRPNILFILLDDLDLELFRHMPKVERLLTRQGVEFASHFISLSLCGPSRASILRGQYAHNTGVLGNDAPYGGFEKFFERGLESSTVGTWLQRAGYRTGFMGKYLNNYPGLTTDAGHVPPGWDTWFVPNGGNEYRQLDYSVNADGRTLHFGHAPDDHFNDVMLQQAQRFLRAAAADPPRRPFFLEVAPFLPHGPSMAPNRYLNHFPGLLAPRPPAFNEADVRDKPRWVRQLPPLDAAAIRRIDRFYRRRRQATEALDDMVESLLQTLQGTGQEADTVVVLSSDNGFQQGEHRIASDKRRLYEQSIRVPLVLRGPGIPAGRVVRRLTANVDLAPTFAALAGAAVPGFVDGRPLLPLLGAAAPARWRQSVLLESQPPALNGLYQSYHGLRTADDQTFVVFDSGEGEYYDLRADPWQLDNRFDTLSPARKSAFNARLQALRDAGGAPLRRAEELPASPR